MGYDVLMLRNCVHPGCEILTLGSFCVYHEPPVEPRSFPRGRPYRLREREPIALKIPARLDGDLTPHAVSLSGGP
jgi:hypothetical protein